MEEVIMDELLKEMKAAWKEREWDQFHSPKNLAMALGSEVGEVLDILRWKTEEESHQIAGDERYHLEEEIGDVFMVLVQLAGKLGIDPIQAAKEKLEKLKKKYPVEACRGKSLKHSIYANEELCE